MGDRELLKQRRNKLNLVSSQVDCKKLFGLRLFVTFANQPKWRQNEKKKKKKLLLLLLLRLNEKRKREKKNLCLPVYKYCYSNFFFFTHT